MQKRQDIPPKFGSGYRQAVSVEFHSSPLVTYNNKMWLYLNIWLEGMYVANEYAFTENLDGRYGYTVIIGFPLYNVRFSLSI